jgi:hypothetical protein
MTDQRINIQASFNGDFCQSLEYHLCAAFATSTDIILKYWGCDGVDEPIINEQFTSRNITSIKQIITKAWIGADGNGRYDMIIKLGRCSRIKALKGFSLESCLPDADSFDWVKIDVEGRLIVVKLN